VSQPKRKTNKPAGARRRVQAPSKKNSQPPKLVPSLIALAAAVALVVGVGVALTVLRDSGSPTPTTGGRAVRGLPRTPDYHSLLVSRTDGRRLVLGTHYGLFESHDGGATWRATDFGRRDAMNLARTRGPALWAAGHNVLAKSTDGGKSWSDVSPPGLPYLDVHGFAVDPRNSDRLYAAIAGNGLYRSTDAGASFELVTDEVGGDVFALAVTRDGRILAGDTRRGLLSSSDGGQTWTTMFESPVLGLAVNPTRPQRILAAGQLTQLSSDGGRHWKPVLALNAGTGPVAWAESAPGTAYVVGFDRTLYRSSDGGENWQPVGGKEESQ
jgi:photosystem II stability/assembly factor-like uncharacterized protein